MMEEKDVLRFIDATGFDRRDIKSVTVQGDKIGLTVFAKDNGNRIFCEKLQDAVTYVVYVGWDGKRIN